MSGGDGGGGGGGGGGSNSRSGDFLVQPVPAPQVLGEVFEQCQFLIHYLHIDWDNDPYEVQKLQAFLKHFEGFSDLPVTGFFDQQTFDAVVKFQERYFGEILEPWGHEAGTGFVYITTSKKINEIVCQTDFPLTAPQLLEIAEFRLFLSQIRSEDVLVDSGAPLVLPSEERAPGEGLEIVLGSLVAQDEEDIGIKDTIKDITEIENLPRGSIIGNLASSALALPGNLDENTRCAVTFVLTLFIMFLIAHLFTIRDSANPEADRSYVLTKKLVIFTFGISLFIFLFLMVPLTCVIGPLSIVFAVSAIWSFWRLFGKRRQAIAS